MKRISLKNLNGVEILTKSELTKVEGGKNQMVDRGCCLHQLWEATLYYTETCGISKVSADYACQSRKATNEYYSCHVTC